MVLCFVPFILKEAFLTGTKLPVGTPSWSRTSTVKFVFVLKFISPSTGSSNKGILPFFFNIVFPVSVYSYSIPVFCARATTVRRILSAVFKFPCSDKSVITITPKGLEIFISQASNFTVRSPVKPMIPFVEAEFTLT